MRTSLAAPQGDHLFLESARIEEGLAASRKSRRGRMIVPLQRSEDAPVQRMLNVLQPGSYIRPHLHPRPQAAELVCVLQGALGVFLFGEAGQVTQSRRLQPGASQSILDLEAKVWHTFVALEADTVVLEVKGGPYDRAQDKLWPEWAPAESSPEAGRYLESLLARLP
ncbi:MAG: WbuC family cupin fold metalloprotein [Verrucomicrobiota bacterium]